MQNTITSVQKTLLDFCVDTLFGKKTRNFENVDFERFVQEAKEQTVLTVVAPALKKTAGIDIFDDVRFMRQITKNARVCFAHEEIHNILSENDVDYVVLKGVASASYYKQPMLRTMGDVDLLVRESDLEKCDKMLGNLSYVRLGDFDTSKGHIRYRKKHGNNWITCEVHRCVNGVPDNLTNIADKYFEDIFKQSVLFETPNSTCIIPSKFHHGLILLLHTAAHLTSEGIGLRHMCDWAVFINNIENQEFIAMFERPLRKLGLLEFARHISLCCVKYLGCEYNDWMGKADDTVVEEIICDIFNGGNFGNKDEERTRQIKYIKSVKNKTVDGKNPASQVFYNIDLKAKNEYKFVRKNKYFLPIGWILVVFKYFGLVISGKRKLDGLSTVSNATARKELYSKFRLFQTDDE